MPTTQTIKPSVTGGGNAANWSVFPAPSNKHDVLADNSTGSYIYRNTGEASDAAGGIVFDLTTYALAADERCLAVRVAVLRSNQAGTGWSYVSVGPGGGNFLDTLNIPNDGTLDAWIYGQWIPDPAGGTYAEWTQAAIDAAQIKHTWVTGTGNHLIKESWLQLDIHKKPTVSVSSPTVDQVMPSLPVSVGWTYVGDGDVQKKYRMKVFTAAVAEGGGFNVDTSATVYDSGEVSGSGASASIPSGIDYGGQYYVYVKVAKDFNGADWWSDWTAGRRFRVNARPVAVVSAPAGAVANTNKPTVVWSYTDAEGDVQTHYRVAIFERPGASWAGFDPDAATPYWDSGEVAGSVGSLQVAQGLLNLKTYRAYVKVKQSSPSIIESVWAYSDFTTNFSAAAVPTVATTAYEDRVDVLVTPGAPIVPAANWIDVERSLDGGTTWAPFRYGTLALSKNFSPAAPFTITDYEVPLRKQVKYRAYSVTTASGQEVASAPSAVANATPTGKTVWLKDPSNGALGRHFYVEDGWLASARRRSRFVLQPLGRRLPVVIRGSGSGLVFGMAFLVETEATYDALMALVLADRTLFLQTPKGNFYVEVSGDITDLAHLWDDLHGEEDVWRIQVPFVEVDF